LSSILFVREGEGQNVKIKSFLPKHRKINKKKRTTQGSKRVTKTEVTNIEKANRKNMGLGRKRTSKRTWDENDLLTSVSCNIVKMEQVGQC
jgi:hypothetical protein